MSSSIENFLTTKEEEDIIQAIRDAELKTSGEIRVHIESNFETTIETRTLEVFSMLKMYNTQQRNGVLIYVAVNDHAFAIYGDQGINDKVADDFWERTEKIIETHFRAGHFRKGLVEGILHAGQQLKRYFPVGDADTDELTNTISKG